MRLRNMLNTSRSLVNKNSLTWWYLLKASWRHLYKTSWRCLEDVFARCLEDVLKTYDQGKYIGLDQDVFKTSPRRLLKIYDQGEYIGLDQDVFKTSWRRLLKAETKESSRRLCQGECLLGSSFWNKIKRPLISREQVTEAIKIWYYKKMNLEPVLKLIVD